jgi:SAM-dependent methyltransferase
MGVKDFYDQFYLRAEQSAAHAEFCELVYGKNLCQHGMADMNQIGEMIKALEFTANDRIIDLGCGNGFITEYLADIIGAPITGVDFSEVTIERAMRRVLGKRRIKFEVGDIRNLHYPADSFTKAISIDTHYFVDDFDSFLLGLLKILTPQGKIGIFSDEGLGIEGNDERTIMANETLIGKLLDERHLKYTAVNLTETNRNHWRLKEKVLKDLQDDFTKEDNLFLFNNRLQECTSTDRDLGCRFLFVIEKP